MLLCRYVAALLLLLSLWISTPAWAAPTTQPAQSSPASAATTMPSGVDKAAWWLNRAESELAHFDPGENLAAAAIAVLRAQNQAGITPPSPKLVGMLADSVEQTRPEMRTWMYRELALAQGRLGDLPASQATIAKINDSGLRAQLLREIEQPLTPAADMNQTLEAAKSLPDAAARAALFSQAAKDLWRKGDHTQALRILNLARDDLRNAAQPQRSTALARLAIDFASAGDLDASLKLAQEIASPLDKAELHLALAQVRPLPPDQAKGVLAQAMTFSAQVNDAYQRAWLRRRLAAAQTLLHDMEAARKTLWRASQDAARLVPDQAQTALRSIAVAQCQIGDFNSAQSSVQNMTDPEQRSWAWRAMAAQARDKDQALTHRCLTLALADARAVTELTWRDASLHDTAVACALAGQVALAQSAAGDIQDPNLQGEARYQIVLAQARSKDGKAAMTTLEQTPNAFWRQWPVVEIATTLAQVGDMEGALMAAQRVADADMQQDARQAILMAQARSGDASALEKLMASATDPRAKSRLLRNLAQASIAAGDVRHAKELIHAIEDPGQRSRASMELMQYQIRQQDWTGAHETLAGVERPWRNGAMRDAVQARYRAGDVGGLLAWAADPDLDPLDRVIIYAATAETMASPQP